MPKSSKDRVTFRRIFSRLLLVTLIALVSLAGTGRAQSFATLYTFTGGADGGHPYASLVRDSKGNLYGTTYYSGKFSAGVVFKLPPNGKEKVLHAFSGGSDGAYPYSSVVLDAAGNVYGTTAGGGHFGAGTVFEITPQGKFKTLHAFQGPPDGASPMGGLIFDSAGNLYGTTLTGGTSELGNVFKLSPTGKITNLLSFNGANGAQPYLTNLVMDKNGDIYGITQQGGANNLGVLYKLSKGKQTLLHTFTGQTSDGCSPMGIPAMDSHGNLYGTAEACGANSYGLIWQWSPKTGETILHNFDANDCAFPYAGVILDGSGNLYGVTQVGGFYGYGTVYEFNGGGLTLLYSFAQSVGANPYGGVIRDAKGNLYGTVSDGGSDNWGIVWEIAP